MRLPRGKAPVDYSKTFPKKRRDLKKYVTIACKPTKILCVFGLKILLFEVRKYIITYYTERGAQL